MSNRLTEILTKSKAVMQATEQSHGSTSNTNGGGSNMFSNEEKEIPNLTEKYMMENSRGTTSSVAPQNGKYRNLEKSKMPDFIKQAMIDEPIDIPETPNHTFDLDDVPELVQENTQYEEKQSVPQQTKTTNINKNVIRKIIKEEMEDVVRGVIEEYLDRSLVTEDIQIKVGGTTFSGKLKPLPKKRKKRV